LDIDMPIPTLDKTWQHCVNDRAANTNVLADDNRSVLWAIKQSLIGISSVTGRSLNWTNPWTVSRSSDSTLGGTGAGDYWDSITDVVWSLTAHSWIVLRQPGTGIELCLDLSNGNTGFMTQVWSPADGFTGGTQFSRPTATDEIILLNNSTWIGGQAVAYGARINVMTTTDGTCTRVIIPVTTIYANAVCLFWLFDQAKDPVSGWANSNIILLGNHNTSNPVSTIWYLSDNASARGIHGATLMSLYMSNECTWRNSSGIKSLVRSAHTTAPNDFSGEWPLITIGLTSQTSGATGRHGQLHDIWFGSDFMHGKTYPNNLTNRFAQFHNIVVPWNGEGVILRG